MKQKKFIDTKQKAHLTYGDPNIFRAILKTGLPGLLISLMTGIYIFVDQLLLANLVPKDPQFNFEHIFSGFVKADVESWIKAYTDTGHTYHLIDASGIVKSAVSITLPLIFVMNAIPNITATGAGTIYTQAISYGNMKKGLEVWKTTFYLSILIGIVAALLIFSVTGPMLEFILGPETNFYVDDLDPSIAGHLHEYETEARKLQIEWSRSFMDILCWTQILNIFVVYLSFMIRAEGRMNVVTLAGIGCNLINILLDFVMIKYGHMGMAGASAATAIGWSINVVAFLIYLHIMSKRNETWMKLKATLPRHGAPFSVPLMLPVFIIGFSVFLRNFANAFSNTLFITLLTSLAATSDNPQYYQMIHGAISPITTLFFYGIFGIADGARSFVAYNYARHEFARIKKAYWYAITLSLIYSFVVYISLVSFLGGPLLSLFDLAGEDLALAKKALVISAIFIPFLSISLGGLLIFQATNELAMSNFVAIINGWISFPIVASFMYFITLASGDPINWYYSTPINSVVTGGLTTLISQIYMNKFLGKVKIKIPRPNKKDESLRTVYLMAKPSIAQKELMKEVKHMGN